jgi:benzylsuccinate CoA-transferase BbsE subunit
MAERLLSRRTVLDSVRVADWTDQTGAYAGRLLADLGADVVRIETADPQPWPEESMAAGPGGEPVSALERYVNLNKRSLQIDSHTQAGRDLLVELLGQADIVITSGDAASLWEQSGNPLGPGVHVRVSPFGQVGGGEQLAADDLVTLAAGGLLSLGGYPEAEPVAVYGNQAYLAGGINAAVSALLGLLARDAGHGSADLDVSVQAVMASALEDAAAEFDLTGVVRQRTGDGLREAGTGTFACADGWVVVVAGKLGTAEAWDSLVGWLCDQDVEGAEALKAPEWSTLEHRRLPGSIAAFQQVMESATAGYAMRELYTELQGRRIAAAPVNSIADLMTEPQLADRQFFRQITDDWLARPITYPGSPYRLTEHVMRDWTPAPVPGQDTEQVLRDWLDLGDERLAALRSYGVIA